MGLSLQHLVRYADEEDLLNRIVTGDESWVHQYQPESKHTSPSTKKFKVMPSGGKVMLAVFWDSKGILLAHFQKYGENVNFASYHEVLLKLWDVIHRKYPCQLEEGYCFIMTMPDTSTTQATQKSIQELQWELLEHLPCSPDLAHSDLHLFGPRKPPWWKTFH
jgi:histone-lysine N-methyltransferase SETMAR